MISENVMVSFYISWVIFMPCKFVFVASREVVGRLRGQNQAPGTKAARQSQEKEEKETPKAARAAQTTGLRDGKGVLAGIYLIWFIK